MRGVLILIIFASLASSSDDVWLKSTEKLQGDPDVWFSHSGSVKQDLILNKLPQIGGIICILQSDVAGVKYMNQKHYMGVLSGSLVVKSVTWKAASPQDKESDLLYYPIADGSSFMPVGGRALIHMKQTDVSAVISVSFLPIAK